MIIIENLPTFREILFDTVPYPLRSITNKTQADFVQWNDILPPQVSQKLAEFIDVTDLMPA
ncbi:hypothetical protein [Desulfogranum marinum]|uniref:hypothetical protein n=1 Tax=Desulfogranum marinum TaxID=453220 RepID=UPI00374CBDA7